MARALWVLAKQGKEIQMKFIKRFHIQVNPEFARERSLGAYAGKGRKWTYDHCFPIV